MKQVHFVAAAGLVLALTGCGGGGDGGGGSPSDRELEVGRELGGLSVPSFTADEFESGVDRAAGNANTLVLSDTVSLVDVPGLPSELRFHTQCMLDRCEQEEPISGETVEVTLDEYLADDGAVDSLVPRPAGERYGIRIARVRFSERTPDGDMLTFEGYGGWMEYGAFLVSEGEIQEGDFLGARLFASSSFGDSPNTVPDMEASWNGIVAGVDTSRTDTQGNIVQGQVRIGLESPHGAPVVDVAFTDLYDLETEEGRDSIYWDDVPVTPLGFSDGSSIDGRFYGSGHEEASGVFERDDLLGAFGATKQE